MLVRYVSQLQVYENRTSFTNKKKIRRRIQIYFIRQKSAGSNKMFQVIYTL